MTLKFSDINRYDRTTISEYIQDSRISPTFTSEKYKEEARKANEKIDDLNLKYADEYNKLDY